MLFLFFASFLFLKPCSANSLTNIIMVQLFQSTGLQFTSNIRCFLWEKKNIKKKLFSFPLLSSSSSSTVSFSSTNLNEISELLSMSSSPGLCQPRWHLGSNPSDQNILGGVIGIPVFSNKRENTKLNFGLIELCGEFRQSSLAKPHGFDSILGRVSNVNPIHLGVFVANLLNHISELSIVNNFQIHACFDLVLEETTTNAPFFGVRRKNLFWEKFKTCNIQPNI